MRLYGRTLAFFLMLLAFGGCASAPTPSPAPEAIGTFEEPVQMDRESVVFLAMYDSETIGDAAFQARMTAALQEKLDALGVPYALEMRLLSPQGYHDTLESGERYDVALAGNVLQPRVAVDMGYAVDLTERLPLYPGLAAMHPEAVWNAWKEDGKDYFVPLDDGGRLGVGWESSFLVRRDILKALDALPPTSYEELIALAVRAKEQGLDYQIAYSMFHPPYALHRTYDEWPFFVDENSLFLTWQDGTSELYFETEIFERDRGLLGWLQGAGVGRCLFEWGQIDQVARQWNVFAAAYPVSFADQAQLENLQIVQFSQEKVNFRIEQTARKRGLFVSAQGDADRALTVLEALYTDQAVYDTFLHGAEGTDWTLHPNGEWERIDGQLGNEAWYSHIAMERVYRGEAATEAEQFAYSMIIDYPVTQFQFTPSAEREMQLFQNDGYRSLSSGVLAIRSGIAPADAMPEAIRMLYEAGIQAHLREYQEQYADYLALFGD